MRSALAFLTPVPVGASVPTASTLAWFPAVGALVGAAVGLAWAGADELFPPLVAAGVCVAADVVLTGALHADGLADTADGLLAHVDGPERRRAIMAAPDIGAFGAVALVAVVGLRWSAFASLEPDAVLVAGLWCGSRAVMALALGRGPYVGGGLGAAFLGASPWWGVGGVGLAGVLVGVAAGGTGIAALAVLVAAAAGVVALGHARLGGVTGDVLGAAGLVGETAGLVLATAAW